MLAANSYPRDYIEACRARIDAQMAVFRKLVTAKNKTKDPALDKAFEAFESVFFNNLVVVLDGFFVHRTRAVEKKDGNPLNEVRLLVASMMLHNELMTLDSAIKLTPAKSILKYEEGDKIRLTAADFLLISKAFFSEIEKKFAA